jgi:hypothetical protein
MTIINKLTNGILLAVAVALTISCFVFALFFSVATLGAVTQASFIQVSILLSLCVVFCVIGNGFLTATELLCKKCGGKT